MTSTTVECDYCDARGEVSIVGGLEIRDGVIACADRDLCDERFFSLHPDYGQEPERDANGLIAG